MRLVNLLPETYRRKAERRWAVRRNYGIMFALLVVSAGGFAASVLEARQVHARVLAAERRVEQEEEQGRNLARLTAQQGQFRASEDLVASLQEPVPVVAILAALSRAVPEEVVLNRLVVDTPNDGRGNGIDSVTPISTSAGGGKGANPLKIELGGLAHSDREVVRCLSRIAEQPLFVNVKLGKSRHIQESNGARVAFQITLEVPVNRELIVSGKDGSHVE